MTDSILNSIKKNVGLTEDYTAFDSDIIMYINSVFSTLKQLGVGPDAGFSIDDASTEWVDYLGADLLDFNEVRTYITLRVRMLFDPPQTSFHVTAMKEQIQEHEWRLNVTRENTEWIDPNPIVIPEEI
jgi:hypothetical protein